MRVDPAAAVAELEWLKNNPAFDERPATLSEFLGPEYLNIKKRVRQRIRKELSHIIGEEVSGKSMTAFPLAMITGGIGIGKTTIGSIVLSYLAHWVLCLRDPQDFFDLLPGSRIAFMEMSTSEKQALEVVFGDIKARIEHSPWFQKNYPMDPNFRNQIRFEKDIWILPGDSRETTFEGYNILGGILDEADSHLVTDRKDYAEQGYTTIFSRIQSRFGQLGQGFLLVIGQMKMANGFAARKYEEFSKDPKAYAVRLAIWESFGWDSFLKPDGTRDSFWYDPVRKQIVSDTLVQERIVDNATLLEVPNAYKKDFENNPEKALRDLAGIPPAVGDPFITLVYKIHDCRDRWIESHGGYTSPVRVDGKIEDWFKALESLKRVGHIDIAYSGDGDALGFAMGHVRELREIDDEMKPYIVFDLLMRIKAPSGSEIFLGDVRRIIYYIKQVLKFRLGYVSLDGFQSTDTIQQFNKKRIESELVSVDKTILPYHDLREAIYEDRIEFPKYIVHMNPGDVDLVEIAVKELSELVDNGKKIDHPSHGSKDVADAMAGVCYKLMGDRSYHKKVVSIDSYRQKQGQAAAGGYLSHPAYLGDGGLSAPLPPSMGSPWSKG